MKIKNMFKKISLYKYSFFVCFVLSFFVSACSLSLTNDFRLDLFCKELVSYNQVVDYESYDCSFLRISGKDEESKHIVHNKLFSSFYYNIYTGGVRQYATNNLSVDFLNQNILFNTQATYFVHSDIKIEDCYYLDFGLFCAYYTSEMLSGLNFVTARFGCSGFVFISDILADSLVSYYNLDDCEDPYMQLILTEDYAKLPITFEDGNVLYFSINNILSSKLRDGERHKMMNPYFMSGYISSSLSEKFDTCLEIDFKNSIYCIKSILDAMHKYGYLASTYDYSFYQCNVNDYSLSTNEIHCNFENVYKNTSNIVGISFYILHLIIDFVFLLYFTKYSGIDKKTYIKEFLAIFILLILHSLIVNFIYSYPYFIVSSILLFAYFVFFGLKTFRKQKNNLLPEKKGTFYDIEI